MLPCGCTAGRLCGEAQSLWQNVLSLWRGYAEAAIRNIYGDETDRAWDRYIEARRAYSEHIECRRKQ